MREEKLAQLQEDDRHIEAPKQADIDALSHLQQQENEIKQKEYERNAVQKDIDDKSRELKGLKLNIGWEDVHEQVDSSEAMKSHVSEQLQRKQELTASLNQLDRNIEENRIEQDTNQDELNQLEQDIVPDETFEKKKQHQQQRFELEEKNNLFQK